MTEFVEKIYEAVLAGDMQGASKTVEEAIVAGIPADQILNDGLIAAMSRVGYLFEIGEYFVPEMLIAARAMQGGLNLLRPKLVDAGVEPKGKVVIGTVKGDLHDIGKNLVSMMLEGSGFEVVDLGTDVAPQDFIEAIKDGADILGLSALLTTTMASMEMTIKEIEEVGLRDQVKIMIGGAPVTQDYADAIGADGFASDANSAASVALRLVNK
ncbi:MAG: corrinoid protein [Anaerolineales bacterium]|jgi:5-methyltetrahydrofolate--homocysteine methyltransferase